MKTPERWRLRAAPTDALVRETEAAAEHIREGRFQRSLAVIAGLTSALSGLEVTYEHYRGSYGQSVMYTPVIMSQALLIAGLWGAVSRRAARSVLRAVSALTLADCFIGFGYHVRGVARKPGGWRLPVTNVVMGPPVLAPLLFGTSAYLGLVASFLRREEDPERRLLPGAARPLPAWVRRLPVRIRREEITWAQDLREGRFQRHLAAATAFSAFASGVEALYSHYKSNFKHPMQWTPVVVAPVLTAAALGAMRSRRIAHTFLPAASLLAIANGGAGAYYHARGVLRRPGGLRLPLYNIMYGPPVLAPLLFAACGFLGLLASLLRRER